MQPSSRTVRQRPQTLRRLRDIRVSTWYRSLGIIIIYVKENHVELKGTPAARFLDEGGTDVLGLVGDAAGEQVDAFYLCDSGKQKHLT